MQDDNQQPQPVQQPQPQPVAPPQPFNTTQATQPVQAPDYTPVTPQDAPQFQSAGMFQRRIGRLGFFLGQVYSMLFFIVPVLLYAVLSFTTSTVDGGAGVSNPVINIVLFLWGAVGLLLLFPVIVSLYVRRLHDIGQSGPLALLALVPFVSLIFYLYLQFAPGHAEPNQYGPRVTDNRPLVALGIAKPRQ